MAMAFGITKFVEFLWQALSNQYQRASLPYMYQNPHYITPKTQHSLIQFPQPQRNVAKFQPHPFSSVADSANSQ